MTETNRMLSQREWYSVWLNPRTGEVTERTVDVYSHIMPTCYHRYWRDVKRAAAAGGDGAPHIPEGETP